MWGIVAAFVAAPFVLRALVGGTLVVAGKHAFVRAAVIPSALFVAVVPASAIGGAFEDLYVPEIVTRLPADADIEQQHVEGDLLVWPFETESDSRLRARMSHADFLAYARSLGARCERARGRIECQVASSSCYRDVASDPIDSELVGYWGPQCWGHHCFAHTHYSDGIVESRQYCGFVED